MDVDFETGSDPVTDAYSGIQDLPGAYTTTPTILANKKVRSLYATRSGTIVLLDKMAGDAPAQSAFPRPNADR